MKQDEPGYGHEHEAGRSDPVVRRYAPLRSRCEAWRHYVRIHCTACGTTKGVGNKTSGGENSTVQADTFEECSYLKILHQRREPGLDSVADKIATLGLDLQVREPGRSAGAFNPFLLGY